MMISAMDRGTPMRSSPNNFELNVVVKDINDNAPTFSQPSYETSISENATIGDIVLAFEVTDPDQGVSGQVVCDIKSDSPVFRLNAACTKVFLNRRVDYEIQKEYEFNIVAKGNGLEHKTTRAKVC